MVDTPADLETFKNWELPPDFSATLAKQLAATPPGKETTGRETPGYHTPLHTPAIPEHLKIFSKRDYRDPKELAKIAVKAAAEKSADTIVIVYPTKLSHLAGKTVGEVKVRNDKAALVQKDLLRLDISENVLSFCKKTKSACHDKGLKFKIMPLFKVTENSSVGLGAMGPVRFWSPTAPKQNAIYIPVDDIVEKGRTVAAMCGLLTANGVEGSYIPFVFTRQKEVDSITLSERQKAQILDLRQHHKDICKRADAVVKLVGIDKLESLLFLEANHLGINGHNTPGVVDMQLKEFYTHIGHKLPPIPDASPELISGAGRLGFGKNSSTSREGGV
jgi:hypothetical protein